MPQVNFINWVPPNREITIFHRIPSQYLTIIAAMHFLLAIVQWAHHPHFPYLSYTIPTLLQQPYQTSSSTIYFLQQVKHFWLAIRLITTCRSQALTKHLRFSSWFIYFYSTLTCKTFTSLLVLCAKLGCLLLIIQLYFPKLLSAITFSKLCFVIL
jgi:hypothetical protein